MTDVLVNGPNQVFIDRGAGLELTDLRFPCEGDVRRLAQRLAASAGRRSTMQCLSLTQEWPTEAGCMQFLALWRRRAPAFRSVSRPTGLLARRLRCLWLTDSRHGAASVTHDRGQAGIPDKRWNRLWASLPGIVTY